MASMGRVAWIVGACGSVALAACGGPGGSSPCDACADAAADQASVDARADADANANADAGAPHTLILHDFMAGPTPTPTFIQTNLAYLETLPFDGLVVYMRTPDLTINLTASVMTTTAFTAQQAATVLSPIQGITFKTLTHNLAFVVAAASQKPPDFFDDWSVVEQNFATLAQAAKAAGLRGIFLDNEQYLPWADYTKVAYPSKTLAQYQDQARLRGHECMAAIVGQFPDAVILTTHGPYVSVPNPPPPINDTSASNLLLGPFFVGFVEAEGASATVVDGGELYSLRTPADFQATYDFRKTAIATQASFIPSALQPSWSADVSIAFGTYDTSTSTAPMDPAILQPTLTNALSRSDRFVWLYTETVTFLLPASQGGASSAWRDAVQAAKAAVP